MDGISKTFYNNTMKDKVIPEFHRLLLNQLLCHHFELMRRYFLPALDHYLLTCRLARYFPHFKDEVRKGYNPFLQETLQENIEISYAKAVIDKNADPYIEIAKQYSIQFTTYVPRIYFFMALRFDEKELLYPFRHFYHIANIDSDGYTNDFTPFYSPVVDLSDSKGFERWKRDLEMYVIYLVQEIFQTLEDKDEDLFFEFYRDKRHDIWNLQHLPPNPPRPMPEIKPYDPLLGERIYEEFERRMNLP